MDGGVGCGWGGPGWMGCRLGLRVDALDHETREVRRRFHAVVNDLSKWTIARRTRPRSISTGRRGYRNGASDSGAD